MKHSLFTKLMSLFLAFALVIPCFPSAYAEEAVEPVETIGISETTPTAESVPETETTEVPETTAASEETVPAGETVPTVETVPVEETVPTVETLPIEETVPTEETLPTEETVPTEETLPTEEALPSEETLPDEPVFIPLGMPEGYVLSENNEKDRLDTLEHGVLEQLDGLTPGVDYAYGEILVLAESEEEAQLFAEAYGGTLEVYYDGLATILLGDATVPQAVKASLSGEYNIPVASPNYYLHFEPMLTNPTTSFATAAPQEMAWSDWVQNVMDDPDPALLYPDSFEYQYQHDVIDTYAAWGVTTGFSNVTVAVIDSGVDGSHPDLNVTQKTVSGVGLTGDSDGHGTHVCGIIAATMNNGLGGAGVAPYINLYSYRISDSSNRMDSSGLYNAIRQAARDGADVINMSLGGYVYDSVLQNAINYAYSYGAVLVAAMGNDGTNVMCYPAACNNVIAVAATDPSNRRAFFSNYGDWCDISAPGVDIFSTYPGSDYAWMSGTSQATPVVTGAIALYLSYNINNSGPANVEKVLKSSATKCSDKGMGAGIVNIANMIDEKPPAPAFMLEYNGSMLYDHYSYSGQQLPCETTLVFGSFRTDDQFFFVYTMDGKNPSVKNGEVVHGNVYSIQYPDSIDLSPYAGSSVTVKVMMVSGMGIPGKVRTIKLKVGESTHISSVNITGPNIMISGKSSQFAATVTPEDTANQGVRWSIRSYTGSLHNASINQKGILSTPSGASGTVTVRATSLVNSNKYADHTVQVQPASPVAKIKLDHTSGYTYVGRTFRLNVTQLEDKLGNSISPDLFGVLWTSSNKKIATVDSNGNVTALAKGKVTITCKSLDGSNKSAKCTVTVKQQITDITITGNEYIAPGSSSTLKASVAPSNVTSKSVVWTLASGPNGVTVSSSGKVTVPSYITSGTIQVQATAKDGMGAYNTHTMTIQPKITGNRIEARSSYSGWAQGFAYKSGKLSTVNLFSVDLTESSGQDNYCALKSVTSGRSVGIVWTSSNPQVASVSGNGYITAHKAGTAKITCTPTDGSKKTASVTIKVTNPVSYMAIKTTAPQMTNTIPYIGFGKSVTNTVVFGDTYGTPSNKKVVWDYSISEYDSDGYYVREWTSTFKNNKLVTLKNGKVTVSSKVKSYWANIGGEFELTLYARSTDGSGVSTSLSFLLTPPSDKITMIEGSKYTFGRNNLYSVCFASSQRPPFNDDYFCGFTVTSSNPKVCGAVTAYTCEHYYSSTMHCYDLVLSTGNTKGSAKITIKSTDGSNKSMSFTVTVR